MIRFLNVLISIICISLLVFFVLDLVGCFGVNEPCAIRDNNDGTQTISCRDGTSVVIPENENGVEEIINTIITLRNQYGPNVFDVWCIKDLSVQRRGTGTKTIDGTVITAHHVVDGCDSLSFFQESVHVGDADEWIQDGVRDIVEAVSVDWNSVGLELPGIPPTFNITPSVGDQLYLISHPSSLRRDIQITFGLVVDDNVNSSFANTNREDSWSDAFIGDYAAGGGSSGGPVFNADMEWFGIHVGGFRNGIELDIALPLQE